MKEVNRFRLGTLFYWASLACCLLAMFANGFSFAGGGVSITSDTHCLVTNENCPKCALLNETHVAKYNMAGEMPFRYSTGTAGDYSYNGSQTLGCFKTAMCKDITRYETHSCNPESGCEFSKTPTGCKDYEQQPWVPIYETFNLWVEHPEN